MARRFTLTEARALLPRVSRLIGEAVALKAEYQQAESALGARAAQINLMGGMAIDRGLALEARKRRDSSAERLGETLRSIEEVGCEVKDLDVGLIDFPSLFRGEEVCLCWKLGEPDIEYWHGVQEGFAGRKRIDDDFLRHHEGERTN